MLLWKLNNGAPRKSNWSLTNLLSLLPSCIALMLSSTSCIKVEYPEDEKQDYDNYYYSGKEKDIELLTKTEHCFLNLSQWVFMLSLILHPRIIHPFIHSGGLCRAKSHMATQSTLLSMQAGSSPVDTTPASLIRVFMNEDIGWLCHRCLYVGHHRTSRIAGNCQWQWQWTTRPSLLNLFLSDKVGRSTYSSPSVTQSRQLVLRTSQTMRVYAPLSNLMRRTIDC